MEQYLLLQQWYLASLKQVNLICELILPDTLLLITEKYSGIILQLKESVNSLNIDNHELQKVVVPPKS